MPRVPLWEEPIGRVVLLVTHNLQGYHGPVTVPCREIPTGGVSIAPPTSDILNIHVIHLSLLMRLGGRPKVTIIPKEGVIDSTRQVVHKTLNLSRCFGLPNESNHHVEGCAK